MLDKSFTSKEQNNVINLNEKQDNNFNIFDLKKYQKDFLKFIDYMIKNDEAFDNDFKLSIMPGLISKITILIQSNVKISIKIICSV